MPYAASSTVKMMTATRRCRQMPTNWSIIQQDSAFDNHLLAGLDAGTDGDQRTLLELGVDDAALEGPRRRGDENAGSVVIHQQGGTRQHHLGPHWPRQGDGRKHIGLEVIVR